MTKNRHCISVYLDDNLEEHLRMKAAAVAKSKSKFILDLLAINLLKTKPEAKPTRPTRPARAKAPAQEQEKIILPEDLYKNWRKTRAWLDKNPGMESELIQKQRQWAAAFGNICIESNKVVQHYYPIFEMFMAESKPDLLTEILGGNNENA